MSDRVQIISVRDGIIEGSLRVGSNPDALPQIELLKDGEVIARAPSVQTPEGCGFTMPIPAHVISQGMTALGLRIEPEQEISAHLTISAGQALEQDIYAELAVLRSELDMLRNSFRKFVNKNNG